MSNELGQALQAIAAQVKGGSGIRESDRANVVNINDKTTEAKPNKLAEKKLKAQVRALEEVNKATANMTGAQVDAFVEFGLYALDEQTRRTSWFDSLLPIARRMFPDVASFAYGFYKPVAAWIRAEFGTFAYQQMRKCLELLASEYGCEMPTAGTGKGKGTKGVSAKRTVSAINTTIDKLVEQVAALKKSQDVSAKTLALWTPVLRDLQRAYTDTVKAVNE